MTLTDVRSAFELSEDVHALTDHRDAWDRLAMSSPSPFLTHAWLAPWARSSRQHLLCATVKGPGGELRAGALLRRVPGGLASGAEDFGGDWDVVAADETARRALWEGIVSLKPPRLHLAQLRVGSPETVIASEVLRRSGYGILPSVRTEACPYVALPATFEELLATRSSKARQDVRRRRRKLEQAGRVRFRTTTGGPNLERDWKKFLTVEASGWKGQTKSAIVTRPGAKTLYDDFVHEAAERGWLRLGLLELDGSVIAGQLAVFLGGEGFGLKMGFDESYRDLGPGSVIIAETFREAIEEGLRGMDLLGDADPYKMRWTDQVRPRQRLRVVRGTPGRVAERVWRSQLHPRLVMLRDRARDDPQLRLRLERLQQGVQKIAGLGGRHDVETKDDQR